LPRRCRKTQGGSRAQRIGGEDAALDRQHAGCAALASPFLPRRDYGHGRPAQPDVFVVPIEEARTLAWPTIRTLLLAAEVLSPSSVRADRFTKRRLYQEVGVALYWVIDADARTAEIWAPSDQFPRVETERLVWSPRGTSRPFEMMLTELLRPI
jgi:Uma2 family endonuclease